MGKLERWRTYAELTSKEEDPGKLMELAERLGQALDCELLSHAPVRQYSHETAAQEPS